MDSSSIKYGYSPGRWMRGPSGRRKAALPGPQSSLRQWHCSYEARKIKAKYKEGGCLEEKHTEPWNLTSIDPELLV